MIHLINLSMYNMKYHKVSNYINHCNNHHYSLQYRFLNLKCNKNNLFNEDIVGVTNNDDRTRSGNNTTIDGIKNKKNNLNDNLETDVLPYENRVFVCMGKMKNLGCGHSWIMTIDDNYKDVTFWDPRVNAKFILKGRIENHKILKRFLNREVRSRKDLENESPDLNENEDSMSEDKELIDKMKLCDIFDDRKPIGENDDDEYNYSSRQDSYVFENDLEVFGKDYDMVNNVDDVIKLKKSKNKLFIFSRFNFNFYLCKNDFIKKYLFKKIFYFVCN